MPSLSYSNSAFVTLTRISSSIINAFFTDITTWANTTKLDYLNLQTAGVRASNITSQSSAAGLPLVADGAGAATFSNISTINSGEILNLSLSTSVGSSLLNVNVLTAAAANATSSTPIRIGFRNATATAGTFTDRTVTAALTISSVAVGCTLGLKSAFNQYIYVWAIDNAGTVELALSGSRCFDEGSTYNTTVINGSSTNALVLYSTTARTAVPIRLIGRLQSNQVTSGTYATAMAEVSLTTGKHDKQERSEIVLAGGNGYGSGSTKIMRFTSVEKSVGTGLTYTTSADTATLGSVLTVNEDGLYTIALMEGDGGAGYWGVTINSAQLTTSVSSCTVSTVCLMFWGVATVISSTARTLYLQAGDVIRPHGEAASTNNFTTVKLSVCKVSD